MTCRCVSSRISLVVSASQDDVVGQQTKEDAMEELVECGHDQTLEDVSDHARFVLERVEGDAN